MRYVVSFIVFAALALATLVWSQPQPCPSELTLDPLEGSASDTQPVRFIGRTLTGVTVTAECIGPCYVADASPSSMISAESASGDTVTFKLTPTTARLGNRYKIRVQPSDSAGNTPTVNLCFEVKNVRYEAT